MPRRRRGNRWKRILPLPDRPPINPHAPHLPVPVEEDGVGDASRLQAAEPVLHSQDLSRDARRGFDRRQGGQSHVLCSAGNRDIQGDR
jgi:hypothetical protein